MGVKDWDSWKNHPTTEERMIFKDAAERDQIEVTPWPTESKLMEDTRQVHVRGVFVGTIPKDWTARLRLGDHSPMVIAEAPDGGHCMFTVKLSEGED